MTRSALLFGAALLLTGCGSSNPSNTAEALGPQTTLQEVGGLVQMYSGENRKGPAKPADLAKYEPGYPLGYRAVQSGEVVVVWGATIAGEGEAASAPANVVAYEKKAPAEGGWVLLQNMTTKQMTADEFKAAPKAK